MPRLCLGTVSRWWRSRKERKMRVDCQPLTLAALEDDRRPPWTWKGCPIGMEAGRIPRCDPPGEVSRSTPMELGKVDSEVVDIRPDTGPLVDDQGIKSRYDVSTRPEGQDIRCKMLAHRRV